MANSSPSSPSNGGDMDNSALSVAQAERALLQNILDAEQSAPWLMADTEAVADYDTQAEAAGQALEISDEEAAQGWQGLSAQLSQIWGDAGQTSVLAGLQAKFAGRLPNDLLTMISEKAQQVVQGSEPMMNQMITCVKDGFANVAAADLQVMARPMALAMRGSSADEFVEATMQSVRQDEWEALSPIEQARLSLAAARYAISQAESTDA